METKEKDLAELQRMSVAELCRRHLELFGEEPRCQHRQHLKQYALAIARNCALRIRITENAARRRNGQSLDHTITTRVVPTHDSRLPIPGSLLFKDFKGQTYVVKVLDEGFEFDGRHYRSLSAIAQAITGTKWNGHLFFRLRKESDIGQQTAGKRSTR